MRDHAFATATGEIVVAELAPPNRGFSLAGMRRRAGRPAGRAGRGADSSTATATAASTRASRRIGHDRRKAVRIFLGDEAGRQPPFAPARMPHQRRQERDVVLDAVDDETRRAHPTSRRSPQSRVGAQVQSLAIIGS